MKTPRTIRISSFIIVPNDVRKQNQRRVELTPRQKRALHPTKRTKLPPATELSGTYHFASSNPAERAVYDLLVKRGYQVYKRGWPDLLAVDWKTGKVQFIEVKWAHERIKVHQKDVQKIFELAGIKYKVARVVDEDGGHRVKSLRVEDWTEL